MSLGKESAVVASLVFLPCPNCGEALTYVSGEGPVNTACTVCAFRTRYEMVNSPPGDTFFTADDGSITSHIASGALMPPLIVDFNWATGERPRKRVVFFPFFPVSFFRAPLSSVPLFDNIPQVAFFNLEQLSSMILLSLPSDEEIAEEVSRMDRILTSYVQRAYDTGYTRARHIVDMAKAIRKKRGDPVPSDAEEEEQEE